MFVCVWGVSGGRGWGVVVVVVVLMQVLKSNGHYGKVDAVHVDGHRAAAASSSAAKKRPVAPSYVPHITYRFYSTV